MWYPAFIDWADVSVWKEESPVWEVHGIQTWPDPPEQEIGQSGSWVKIAGSSWWYEGRGAPMRKQQYLVQDIKGRQLAYTPSRADAGLSHPGNWLARTAHKQSGLAQLEASVAEFHPLREQLTRLDVSRDLDPPGELGLRWAPGWSSTQHEVRGVKTGWTVGRGALLCRVYRKDLHDPGEACWTRWGRLPAWRVEFQMRTKELQAWNISSIASIGDINYLWAALVKRMGLFFEGAEGVDSVNGPALHNRSYATFGSEQALLDQAIGCIRSIGRLRIGTEKEVTKGIKPVELDDWISDEVIGYRELVNHLVRFMQTNPRHDAFKAEMLLKNEERFKRAVDAVSQLSPEQHWAVSEELALINAKKGRE